MFRIIHLIAHILRYAAFKLDQVGVRLQPSKANASIQDVLVQQAMTTHNMVAHPDEPYYAKQYLYWIQPECDKLFPEKNPSILDIGCGQGRLALPLAQWAIRGKVIGVDFAPSVIGNACEYAHLQNINNVEFHEAEALTFVQSLPNDSFDIIMLLEILYVLPQYQEILDEAQRVLKSGGLLAASFRSQYFNLLHSIRVRDWKNAHLVVNAREGHWGSGPGWYCWHTGTDILRLLDQIGFSNIHLRGIGSCSGIEGDPLATIARPSQLSPQEQEHLAKIEHAMAEQHANCARYILALATKS